jgi:hypothetical protein
LIRVVCCAQDEYPHRVRRLQPWLNQGLLATVTQPPGHLPLRISWRMRQLMTFGGTLGVRTEAEIDYSGSDCSSLSGVLDYQKPVVQLYVTVMDDNESQLLNEARAALLSR